MVPQKKRQQLQQAVVIGGTGQVGMRLVQELRAFQPQLVNLVATSRKVEDGEPRGPLSSTGDHWWQLLTDIRWSALDLESIAGVTGALRDLDDLVLSGIPGALFLSAAYTNVDGCEKDPALNERVNLKHTQEVLAWAYERGLKPVFFSTDYVFDGTSGPYREEDPRSPICAYGRAKAQVEEWMEGCTPEGLILRTTGVYDLIEGSKNFLMQMMAAGAEGRTVKLPADQEANPVWAVELARAAVELAAHDASGIFHVAGARQMARTDFAKLIAEEFGLENLKVEGIQTASLGQAAKRPLKGGLLSAKVERELSWAPRAPEEVFREMKSPL